jgi:hypothetical protein
MNTKIYKSILSSSGMFAAATYANLLFHAPGKASLSYNLVQLFELLNNGEPGCQTLFDIEEWENKRLKTLNEKKEEKEKDSIAAKRRQQLSSIMNSATETSSEEQFTIDLQQLRVDITKALSDIAISIVETQRKSYDDRVETAKELARLQKKRDLIEAAKEKSEIDRINSLSVDEMDAEMKSIDEKMKSLSQTNTSAD